MSSSSETHLDFQVQCWASQYKRHVQQGAMKMVKGLECLSYKERPRELNVHPGVEKVKGDLIINDCRERLEKKKQTLLSERMSTNWIKANHTKTWGKHFFWKIYWTLEHVVQRFCTVHIWGYPNPKKIRLWSTCSYHTCSMQESWTLQSP